MVSLRVIGSAEAKESLRRALAGQMGDDEARGLSVEVRELAALLPR